MKSWPIKRCATSLAGWETKRPVERLTQGHAFLEKESRKLTVDGGFEIRARAWKEVPTSPPMRLLCPYPKSDCFHTILRPFDDHIIQDGGKLATRGHYNRRNDMLGV